MVPDLPSSYSACDCAGSSRQRESIPFHQIQPVTALLSTSKSPPHFPDTQEDIKPGQAIKFQALQAVIILVNNSKRNLRSSAGCHSHPAWYCVSPAIPHHKTTWLLTCPAVFHEYLSAGLSGDGCRPPSAGGESDTVQESGV